MAGSESSDTDEDQNDLRYGYEEDQTDDEDEAYYRRWQDAQERAIMVAALFGDDSDEEHTPDLVGSDDESDNGNQPNHGNDTYAVEQIMDAVSEYHLGTQEGTLRYTDSDITTIQMPYSLPN